MLDLQNITTSILFQTLISRVTSFLAEKNKAFPHRIKENTQLMIFTYLFFSYIQNYLYYKTPYCLLHTFALTSVKLLGVKASNLARWTTTRE